MVKELQSHSSLCRIGKNTPHRLASTFRDYRGVMDPTLHFFIIETHEKISSGRRVGYRLCPYYSSESLIVLKTFDVAEYLTTAEEIIDLR